MEQLLSHLSLLFLMELETQSPLKLRKTHSLNRSKAMTKTGKTAKIRRIKRARKRKARRKKLLPPKHPPFRSR